MEPVIRTLTEKKLIGKKMTMTIATDKTGELWKSFMLQRSTIKNNVSSELLSMQLYTTKFADFTLTTPFTKWAATEVSDFDQVPEGMETFILPAGLYAVFQYKGSPKDYAPTFQYIFGTWFPRSNYDIDDRPHFEILGEKYKNDSPDSEEEIWVPVKFKRMP
jgi:AraC family transcriptional regulator